MICLMDLDCLREPLDQAESLQRGRGPAVATSDLGEPILGQTEFIAEWLSPERIWMCSAN